MLAKRPKSLFTIFRRSLQKLMKTVRAEHFDKLSTGLSKHERLFASLRWFYSPFDKLRACPVLDTGANVTPADEMTVNRF